MDENLNVEVDVIPTETENIELVHQQNDSEGLSAGQVVMLGMAGMAGTALMGCVVTDMYWTAKKKIGKAYQAGKAFVGEKLNEHKEKKERKAKKQEIDQKIENKTEN